MQKEVKSVMILIGSFRMARNRQRKTDRRPVESMQMKKAVEEVINGQKSAASIAREFSIKRTTLRRYIQKYKAAGDKGDIRFVPKYNARQVFTEEQERLLAEYFITAARYNYGHSPIVARRLAFEFATRNNIPVPENWLRDSSAGEEWLVGLLKRRQDLSIRQPEATSLARGTAFNRHNVGEFFDNLNELYSRHGYGPEAVYNCDETGLTTVQRPTKVIAAKGIKQVGAVTSQERGQLVTVCCTINAIGNTIPPFMIFPRVIFKSHMIIGAPPGTAGTAYPTGWMTCESFVMYLKHFIKNVKCSTQNQVLLVLDNHESHISVDAINLCKENGISLLTFPPHCSHRLQPLDVAVYGPLKAHYNNACTSWLHSNPATPMNIFNIAQCFGEAYPLAFTPKNNTSGFRATGIWPYNKDIFDDSDFAAANVTDRDYYTHEQPSSATVSTVTGSTSSIAPPAGDLQQVEVLSGNVEQPSTSGATTDAAMETQRATSPQSIHSDDMEIGAVFQSSGEALTSSAGAAAEPSASLAQHVSDIQHEIASASSAQVLTTPEQIRPFPKAGERKRDAKKTRKRGSTRILTDTPVKRQIEDEHASREAKKTNSGSKSLQPKKRGKKDESSAKTAGTQKKRRTCNKTKNQTASNDACKLCGVVYGDATDKKRDEMWRCCVTCSRWFHDSCAQVNGILDDGDVFTCMDCVN